MSSGVLTVDRRLPDPAEVRRVLGSTDETWCAGHGTPQSLVRLLYPVFRVQYTYTIEGSFPWSPTETEHDAFLVDGLQAGTTHNLGEYLESAFDPSTAHTSPPPQPTPSRACLAQTTSRQATSAISADSSRIFDRKG